MNLKFELHTKTEDPQGNITLSFLPTADQPVTGELKLRGLTPEAAAAFTVPTNDELDGITKRDAKGDIAERGPKKSYQQVDIAISVA